jgi:hypothetical protein
MSTLFVPFNARILHVNELTFAALVSAQAVGRLPGGVLLSHFGRSIAPARLLGLGALGLGVIDACVFYSPLVTPLVEVPVLFMGLFGVLIAALQAGYLTLAQTLVEGEFRGGSEPVSGGDSAERTAWNEWRRCSGRHGWHAAAARGSVDRVPGWRRPRPGGAVTSGAAPRPLAAYQDVTSEQRV